jgi:hypothetical protein
MLFAADAGLGTALGFDVARLASSLLLLLLLWSG